MKDLNIFIECDNLEQRNNAISVLESMGFKNFDPDESFKNLRVMEGEYFDINFKPSPDVEKFTYQQFMEKYSMNKLHQKINETKVTLGMDNKRLSLALGHHRNYIARVLKNEHSEKFDKNLIKQLDDLIESKKNKVEELPKFVLSKEQCNSCRDAFVKDNDALKKKLEESKHYYLKVVDDCRNLINESNDLKKQLEYKTELLVRKEDEISSLKTDLEKHKVWLNVETDHSEKLEKDITKLEKEIDFYKIKNLKIGEIVERESYKVFRAKDNLIRCEVKLKRVKDRLNTERAIAFIICFLVFSIGLTYTLLNL